MPVQIGEVDNEVTVLDGELPLSEAQLRRIADDVHRRLRQDQRRDQRLDAAMKVRRSAITPLPVDQ